MQHVERELYAIREALAATDHLAKGFQVVVYTDHKNNLFTSSLLSNRRINKKLLRWSLDLEELGSKISRIWQKGVDNVLGDAPSRNPHNRDMLYKLPVPAGPVKRIITAMFAKPIELDQELQELRRFIDSLDGREPAPVDEEPRPTARTETTTTTQASARGDPTPLTVELTTEDPTEESPSADLPDPQLITEEAPETARTRTSLAYTSTDPDGDADSNA